MEEPATFNLVVLREVRRLHVTVIGCGGNRDLFRLAQDAPKRPHEALRNTIHACVADKHVESEHVLMG